MKYRIADILAFEAITAAGTKTIDIVLEDIVSRIHLSFYTQNAIPWELVAGHPAAAITKIELVDGSDVLYSLNGYEIQALNYYDNLVTPDTDVATYAGRWQHASFLLDFGRWLYDPDLAFDPKKFTNPQLKITYNPALVSTNFNSAGLEIRAECFDEKVVSPVGFLMTKEIESYTGPDAEGYKYIDIPTDFPFRKLLVRAALNNLSFEGGITEFKISEDNDKRIPYDMSTYRYIRYQNGFLPKMHEKISARAGVASFIFYVMPTHWPTLVGMSESELDSFARDMLTSEANQQAILAETLANQGFIAVCSGYIPHQTLCLMFGDQKELDDWYDVTAKGSVRLRLKNHEDGKDSAVTTYGQQLRRY